MKLGKEFATSKERYLTSWKSVKNPSIGEYRVWLESKGYPQLFVGENSALIARIGVWNGLWIGTFGLRPNPDYTNTFVYTKEEIYYKYELNDKSFVSRIILAPNGSVFRLNWMDGTQSWSVHYATQVPNYCDRYSLCGAQGHCAINDSAPCACVTGFVPKHLEEWNIGDWSSGCIRETALNCDGDVFRKYVGMRLPDSRYSWFNDSMSQEDCEVMCKNNCTCSGYTNYFIRSGCVLWFGELIDVKQDEENGQDFYIRMAASESAAGSTEKNNRVRQKRTIIIVVPVVTVILLAMCLLCAFKMRKLKRKGKLGQYYTDQSQKHDLQLPLFGLSTLLDATNNFSIDNKLGEGGFGPVYKGLLEDGREIAVKRLSKTSSQGLDEFMNEIICISKLQHRNLVKLLGCSVQGDEKMLVYEYMPNKSLDSLIFDKTRDKLLDWPNRFQIVNGIARGLLYLHQDSRLRIIHRDLKAGNILLDLDMNPKISDFGLARSIRGTETEANTNKAVGTYGYMSPEYAGHGLFSMKSDVYSFGVIVLEIVSGKKNKQFIYQDHHYNLLGYAWRLHEDGKSLELADPFINISSVECEVIRSIQVGLLCVQQRPEDRPSMSSVVLMLSSEIELPQPKKPGFFTDTNIVQVDVEPPSVNQVTISLLNGR